MPRSTAKNNRKSTPSNTSKKGKRRQSNSAHDSDQRIYGGELVEDGVNDMSTPTHSAAPAASPLLPAGTSSTDAIEPIAKSKASIDTKSSASSTSQDGAPPTTPIQNTNQPEVTFEPDPVAASIAASRRRRSRKTNVGRTSRSLSRDEQLMIKWEDEQYYATFNSSKPGADPIARIAITLASGQRVRAGEALAPDLIDIYLSQLREDLTHDQCEKILRPPRPSHTETIEYAAERHTRTVRIARMTMYLS